MKLSEARAHHALVHNRPGVQAGQQGGLKKMRKAFSPTGLGHPMALLATFIGTAAILHAHLQPVVIMITVPFGLVGAGFGHLAMGYDQSMMSAIREGGVHRRGGQRRYRDDRADQ